MKILVVDDDIGTVNAIKAGLTSSGYEIVPAQSGREALDIIQSAREGKEEVGLLLTDYIMPDMNGLDLIKRARKVRPGLPVILMTAYGDDDLREQVSKLDHCGYVEKPFSLGRLLDAIKDLIED